MSARKMRNQCDHEYDQKYEEKYFGNTGRTHCDTGETKNRCDYCDDKKYDCPVQHDVSPNVVNDYLLCRFV
jgi:hypothetical protein